MSADDKALRNATVHMQRSPEVLRFSLNVKGIAMQRVRTGRDTSSPRRPKPEEVSLLREHFSGIASMSADDKALRNATVHMQRSPEVLRFSLNVKGIAMQRVDHDSLRWRLSPKALTYNEHLSP